MVARLESLLIGDLSLIAKSLYYGIQKLRGGVTPRMVSQARELLGRSWPHVRAYVGRRLEETYRLDEGCGFEWLAERPVTTKEEYRRDSSTGERALFRRDGEVRRTSGSSGEPFRFVRDRRMTAWMDAAMWAVYGWYGIEPGDRMARFWGRPLSALGAAKRKIADALLRQRRLSAFDVSRERSQSFFRMLVTWGPKYAYGYPTVMREFVEHLRAEQEDGERLELEVVIATGEVLDRSTRTVLEEFFGCPVVNEYGCSESGVLSFECPAGTPHMVPVAAYPEVDDGDQVGANRAREGEVRVTDLYGDLKPFVRYALGDLARCHPPERCECGRELPRFEPLSGRTDAFIRTPGGRKIYDAVLAYSVPAGVARFRVRQTALDHLEGKVVVAGGYDEARVLETCRSQWSRAVGEGLTIDVQSVESIDRPRSGKRQYFVPLEMSGQERDSRPD